MDHQTISALSIPFYSFYLRPVLSGHFIASILMFVNGFLPFLLWGVGPRIIFLRSGIGFANANSGEPSVGTALPAWRSLGDVSLLKEHIVCVQFAQWSQNSQSNSDNMGTLRFIGLPLIWRQGLEVTLSLMRFSNS